MMNFFQTNQRHALHSAMLSRGSGGDMSPPEQIFLQNLYEDITFRYKITDLTPQG